MKRLSALIGLVAIAAVGGAERISAQDLPSAAAAQDESGAVQQDILILAPSRPVVVRLRITVDGRPFRQVWQQRVEQILGEVDPQKTGRFDLSLATKAAQSLMGAGIADGAAGESLAAIRAAVGDKPLDRAGIIELLGRVWPPLAIRNSGMSGPRAGPALFPLLDVDRDGRLSKPELEAAEPRLATRDFDDNLLISQQELVLDFKPVSAERTAATLQPEGNVLAVGPGADTARAVAALVRRYDRNRDGKLAQTAPAELILSPEQARLLDANGDGSLAEAELASLAAREADLVLPIELGRSRAAGARRGRTVEAPGGFFCARKIDGGYQLKMDDATVTVDRNNRDPAQASDPLQLTAYDADNNGYLDFQEAKAVPSLGEAAVGADGDGDGKLFAAEIQEYLERQRRASAVQLVLTVSDQGQDLFTLADEDNDGVLTHREQRSLVRVLTTDDKDQDGMLGGAEIPQQFRLELSRGGTAGGAALAVGRGRARTALPRGQTAGPAWFKKMDRNGDGDLSSAEFLGLPADFARLDADADGLVDAVEAERAPAPSAAK